jgi:hypothetical protein
MSLSVTRRGFLNFERTGRYYCILIAVWQALSTFCALRIGCTFRSATCRMEMAAEVNPRHMAAVILRAGSEVLQIVGWERDAHGVQHRE